MHLLLPKSFVNITFSVITLDCVLLSILKRITISLTFRLVVCFFSEKIEFTSVQWAVPSLYHHSPLWCVLQTWYFKTLWTNLRHFFTLNPYLDLLGTAWTAACASLVTLWSGCSLGSGHYTCAWSSCLSTQKMFALVCYTGDISYCKGIWSPSKMS